MLRETRCFLLTQRDEVGGDANGVSFDITPVFLLFSSDTPLPDFERCHLPDGSEAYRFENFMELWLEDEVASGRVLSSLCEPPAGRGIVLEIHVTPFFVFVFLFSGLVLSATSSDDGGDADREDPDPNEEDFVDPIGDADGTLWLGTADADLLDGGAGDETLDGGAGNDSLDGGARR